MSHFPQPGTQESRLLARHAGWNGVCFCFSRNPSNKEDEMRTCLMIAMALVLPLLAACAADLINYRVIYKTRTLERRVSSCPQSRQEADASLRALAHEFVPCGSFDLEPVSMECTRKPGSPDGDQPPTTEGLLRAQYTCGRTQSRVVVTYTPITWASP
jgi:hypothetical protein